jgi:Family of unknown function (DUF6058)
MARFTSADSDYLRSNYLTLDELCANRPEWPGEVEALVSAGRLPRPSYVLEDGSGMFPADYFDLVDEAGGVDLLREHFAARYGRATRAERAPRDELEQDWEAYLEGSYGICLRVVMPENIVRKSALVASLSELLMLPRPRSAEWRRSLREQVDELDALEREFAPDYDRSPEHDRPPTRELLIEAARKRFPDVFSDTPSPVAEFR